MNQPQQENVVHIQNLTFCYGEGESRYRALDDVSLTVTRGEFVAITGASGSGKSTLMNLLGTLATSRQGTLEIAGLVPSDLGDLELAALRNRHIGFIFQQFHLLPRLSVLENVLLPISYLTPRPSLEEQEALKKHALDLLGQLGIASEAAKFPNALSGGQKQRVAIARALLLDPKVLLADEPTGALDSKTSAEVLKLFATLHSEGRTIIIITHDPAVTEVAKRRIELKDGRKVLDVPQSGLSLTDFSQTARESTGTSPMTKTTSQGSLQRMKAILTRASAPMHEAWQALASAKLRTALTSLGLMIGVASITIMMTLGQAAQEIILDIFNQAGSDRIYVGLDFRAARSNTAGYWRGLDLDKELPILQNAFAKYGRIVPFGDSVSQNVAAAGNTIETRIQTLYSLHDFLDKGMKIKSGRMIAPHEFHEGGLVALVGVDFIDQLFPPNYIGRLTNPKFPMGERLSLRGTLQTAVTIVGIVDRRDTTFESTDVNSRIYIPLSTHSRYTGQHRITWLAVVPNVGISHRWIADAVTNYLKLMTKLKFPFRAHVPEEMIARIMLFITVFQGLTALIGGLCIVVGGIGIMNIMLVTITERIKEIGLRKALGASQADIKRQFLVECVFLCAASGIAGALIGSIFCNLVAVVGHALLPDTVPGKILISPSGILAGLGTAVICGLAFGMMPAIKASRLDPSEALRSE